MQPDSLGLGLQPNPFDARDFGHTMSMVLGAAPVVPLPSSRYWYPGKLSLNQGSVGACVGFTGANWMQNSPIRTTVNNQTGFDLYAECKKIDGIPNIEGTYSRVLLKILQSQGRVVRYLWATSPADLKSWVLGVGPVLVGTVWRNSMFGVDASGYVLVQGTSPVVGGHEYLIRGYSNPRKAYRIRNSWGPNWGDGQHSMWAGAGGEAWLRESDLNTLIWGGGDNWGDAIGIVEAKV